VKRSRPGKRPPEPKPAPPAAGDPGRPRPTPQAAGPQRAKPNPKLGAQARQRLGKHYASKYQTMRRG